MHHSTRIYTVLAVGLTNDASDQTDWNLSKGKMPSYRWLQWKRQNDTYRTIYTVASCCTCCRPANLQTFGSDKLQNKNRDQFGRVMLLLLLSICRERKNSYWTTCCWTETLKSQANTKRVQKNASSWTQIEMKSATGVYTESISSQVLPSVANYKAVSSRYIFDKVDAVSP